MQFMLEFIPIFSTFLFKKKEKLFLSFSLRQQSIQPRQFDWLTWLLIPKLVEC